MKNFTRYTPIILPLLGLSSCTQAENRKPNILFVISDDQSYPHASAYGNTMVSTPGFDYVAKRGALFNNAYVTSPGSSPSRASILTGLYPWQIEEAGTHASSFPAKYVCFPDMLNNAGYLIGYTGKGWGPGDWEVSGRPYNPAGPEYNDCKLDPPYSGISTVDYTANFQRFLSQRKKGQPFYFWLGTHEPHRPYENMSWVREGYEIDRATTPGFLPSHETIKGDLLDYAVEIQWFDSHLVKCIDELKKIGELDNTIIIVTADNGMSFPGAKANCYDAGLHVPLAICWGDKIKPSQVVEALVSLVDIAPTIMEALDLNAAVSYSGQSILPLITGRQAQYTADAVYAGRERHSNSRYDNLGYPVRSVRWNNYLLVNNFHSERWPAGDPQEIRKGKPADAYYDIDDAPSKSFLIENRADGVYERYFTAAMSKRPEFELFDLRNDAACMNNVAADPAYADILTGMKGRLAAKLAATNDSRIGNDPEIWESYPRLEGKMREFPQPER